MKGDGIPLTPASGPLLPRTDLFAGLLRLAGEEESYTLVVQYDAIAPDTLDRRAFLQFGAFVILAHVDVHEAVRRLGRVNMNVEMQLGERLRAAQADFTDRGQHLVGFGVGLCV